MFQVVCHLLIQPHFLLIPNGGRTSFVPVNYNEVINNNKLKICSVGISGLGMFDNNIGWIGTKGQGLVNIIGSNEYFLRQFKDGLVSDWITDFWIFSDSIRTKKMVASGNNGFSLITNGKVIKNLKLPQGDTWITSIATLKQNKETITYITSYDYTKEDIFLTKYLKTRSLFIGTRNTGLWKFNSGIWRQYTSENSSLLSNCINRLYIMDRKLVILTDKGMAILPVDSQQYDEFAKVGLGGKYSRTIYAMPPNFSMTVPFFQVLKTKDYWFTHKHGLSRYKTNRWINRLNLEESEFQSGRIEQEDKNKKVHAFKHKAIDFPSVTKKIKGSALHWQMFTKEYWAELNPEVIQPIKSNDVTCITANKGSKYIWLIFEQNLLSRMNIELKENPWSKTVDKVDIANWEYPKTVPWTLGTKLTNIWGDSSQYIRWNN